MCLIVTTLNTFPYVYKNLHFKLLDHSERVLIFCDIVLFLANSESSDISPMHTNTYISRFVDRCDKSRNYLYPIAIPVIIL